MTASEDTLKPAVFDEWTWIEVTPPPRRLRLRYDQDHCLWLLSDEAATSQAPIAQPLEGDRERVRLWLTDSEMKWLHEAMGRAGGGEEDGGVHLSKSEAARLAKLGCEGLNWCEERDSGDVDEADVALVRKLGGFWDKRQ